MTHVWDMRRTLGEERVMQVMQEYAGASTLPEWRDVLLRVLRQLADLKRLEPIAQARRAAIYANSYSRLDIVMSWYGRLSRHEWFGFLGDQWSVCDNIARWRPDLRWLLSTAARAELDAMMNEQERCTLTALPQRITVYRGCYAVNRPGLSWSTDRAVAARFPTLSRYRRWNEQPLLRTGTVRRDRVVLKLDRNEQEIIAHHVYGIREEALPASQDA